MKHKEAFESGELFLNQNSKTGMIWPTLYRKLDSGQREIVANLPIKVEELLKGNPFESIAISYHNLYMQQQINELAELMNQTYKSVERIEFGQMDDRIGMLIAGRDQIIFSMNLPPEKRGTAIEMGRSNMITAQKQLLQTLKRRVNNFEAIPDSRLARFWLELKHPGFLKSKDKEFNEIQEYYALFLQATQMIAASYAICGHRDAAEQVFDIAKQDIADIDFEALKTLEHIHAKNPDMLYYRATEYVEVERELCLETAEDYDVMVIEVSGKKLLEVFENGRTQTIQISKSEQS